MYGVLIFLIQKKSGMLAHVDDIGMGMKDKRGMCLGGKLLYAGAEEHSQQRHYSYPNATRKRGALPALQKIYRSTKTRNPSHTILAGYAESEDSQPAH
jgi:hypothetical protein